MAAELELEKCSSTAYHGLMYSSLGEKRNTRKRREKGRKKGRNEGRKEEKKKQRKKKRNMIVKTI